MGPGPARCEAVVAAPETAAWSRGLDWLLGVPDAFAIPGGASEAPLSAVKAVGELGRLAELLLRRSDLEPDVRARLRTLLERAWAAFGKGAVLSALLEERPGFAIVASLYAPFHRSGLRHEETLLRLRSPAGRVAMPPRKTGGPPRVRFAEDAPAVLGLAIADARRALDLDSPAGDVRSCLDLTLLGREIVRRPDRPFLSSVAHAAFFATDFGARPHELPGRVRLHLRRQAPAWIDVCLGARDLDAAAELGLALACAGEEAAASTLERALRAAQREDGSIPGHPPEAAYHATVTGVMASFALSVGLARTAGPEPA